MFSLESAMKKEAGEMRGTLTNIEDKVPDIRKSIEAIRTTSDSLGHKEEDLDDQINDTFDQLVARLEQRRTCSGGFLLPGKGSEAELKASQA